ncbi:MAG: rhodanese-like domain-containing protein [Oscillospiraceae bacterium]
MGVFDIFSKRPSFGECVEKAMSVPEAVLLDVRSEQEYSEAHLPKSINIPLDRIDSIEIEKNRPLFVYCLSGARSGRACGILKTLGYTAVTNIGGISGYNGKTEKGKGKGNQ